ncbi:MAG: ABC transporter ATP-binding protein [Anaerolineae bacterium]
MRYLLRALAYMRPYAWLAAGAYVSLLLATAANLVTPRLVQMVIDRGIGRGDLSFVLLAAVGIVLVALAQGLFNFLRGYLAARVGEGVAFDLRNALYGKLQRLSFGYYDRAQTGQLMTRATNDVELVRMFIGFGFLQFLNAVVMLVATLAILFRMDWQLAALSLLILPLLGFAIFRFPTTVRPIFLRVQQELSRLNTILQENLAGIRVVKAFAREPYELRRFEEQNLALLDENLQAIRAIAVNLPLLFFAGSLGTVIVLGFGGFQVMGGRLSLGELVAFNTYLGLLMMPIGMLGMILAMTTRAGASAERVFEILDAQSDVTESPHARPLPPIRGEVTFEHVSFRYFGGEYVLRDVSFTAKPGQMVALVGATGSGKTTIVNLIPRFYDPTEGRVLVDGVDVREVTLESLRSQIGIVLQETTLFTGTIRENIAFGRPDATDEEIVAAARAAEAHDFILSFPQGYDTPVGERGVTLSGGQKQRIAIARALLLDPRILILDDATSSVDVETEYQIQQALLRLMEGRTSFVIAQRMSTLRHADLILVLDQGRIVAQGTHEELLHESPIYAEFYYLQMVEDVEPEPTPLEEHVTP